MQCLTIDLSDVFVKNPDGTEYIGQVWPGYTVFPDWFSPNAEQYWTEALTNWSLSGVDFSGIWLDMNEISSFCDGSWYAVYKVPFYHVFSPTHSVEPLLISATRVCHFHFPVNQVISSLTIRKGKPSI